MIGMFWLTRELRSSRRSLLPLANPRRGLNTPTRPAALSVEMPLPSGAFPGCVKRSSFAAVTAARNFVRASS